MAAGMVVRRSLFFGMVMAFTASTITMLRAWDTSVANIYPDRQLFDQVAVSSAILKRVGVLVEGEPGAAIAAV